MPYATRGPGTSELHMDSAALRPHVVARPRSLLQSRLVGSAVNAKGFRDRNRKGGGV